ncbi:MAG: glucosamine inositolphosphorylceramide transferase family protein [Cypionkella sp.]
MPSAIAVIVPSRRPRRWHGNLVARLREAGFHVHIRVGEPAAADTLDTILGFEALRFGPGLASVDAAMDAQSGAGAPSLVVDLTGAAGTAEIPTLTVLFDGQPGLDATARAVLGGGQPVIQVLRDGTPIGLARPMVSERIWLTRALNDILIRAVNLVERSVSDVVAGRPSEIVEEPAPRRSGALLAAYWLGIAPKLAHRLFLKARYKPFHWRVGYRFHPAPIFGLGFAATADGYATTPLPAWQDLPDDGSRFYADPFPVAVDGHHFLFVEEYPHATGKGVISVAEAGDDGRFGMPRVVLEETFHLSYPQVFEHDGAFWMIPETAGGRDLYLYRAEQFPDRWVRHATLIENRPLSDATLLQRDGRFWLFAADGGDGSSSDAMLVFHAEQLAGPFLPHVANPILIDQASARPAGAFILGGAFPVLPVQDGTRGYGSGMGLVEVIELSLERVRIGPLRRLDSPGWHCDFKHTTNRAGRLEVIDGVVRQRR